MNKDLKIMKDEENLNNNEDKDESQYSSTSNSSINQDNYKIGFKSKLSIKNIEMFGQSPNQRKFSAPESYSENFGLNFMKIGKETRTAYFNKLLIKGFLNLSNEEKKIKFNNIFIFDWDDTLLCTTVLSPNGYFDDNMIVLPLKMEKIRKLEILVKELLIKTTDRGDTYIITNSEPGWVEYSCKRFFPDTFDLLSKIKIISARGLYEEKYPKEFKTWKLRAFNEIIQSYDKNMLTNIICLGDSAYEIEAAHDLSKKFPNGFIKAIKFRELPKIEELMNQISLVLEKFNYIYSACKNWTITIERKKKNENNEK